MKTLIIGLDAFDPTVFERLFEQNELPHLAKYVPQGGYARFAVTNPAQSEVSWTSIASGLNPGGYGLFDFVHRDPQSYQPFVSLLPTKAGAGGIQFAYPHNANTIFQQAAQQGFPATSLWWPTTFPARYESPVRTIPGLGTPDIQGRLGVGDLFTTATGLEKAHFKTAIHALSAQSKNRFKGLLQGPSQKQGNGSLQQATLEFQLELEDERHARLAFKNMALSLELGQWSPILEVEFKIGLLYSVRAVTRVLLTHTNPEVRLYFLPLQIHPLKSPWRYATPPEFVKDTWKSCGPYLTLGWPQDTTALEEGWIDDEQFLTLCETITAYQESAILHHLRRFNEGLLAIVFDSLDRIQHMFWRDRPDVIAAWYRKLDGIIGRIEEAAAQSKSMPRLLVVSDHGFTRFDYKVHLNRWLLEHGYLAVKQNPENGSLREVDWAHSQAYALGLNSIYLNLAGREGQGSVSPDQKEALSARLCAELMAWKGPDGNPVIAQAHPNAAAFEGAFSSYGPDILPGYNAGYRASQETGLGLWGKTPLEANSDHWGADHCVDASLVPGVIFCNQGLSNLSRPAYRDFPHLAIDMQLEAPNSPPPPPQSFNSQEDEKVIEERLRSLGYL